MTDIKIPFTKIRIVQKNTDPNNSANQVIDLEISTNVLMSHLEPRLDQLHGGNPDNTFARMRFYFLNNAEPALVQDLLNDSKTNFELNFVKEQVAYGVGGAAGEIDNSKPEVNLYQAPTSRMLEVKFSPQFAGIIKLTASGQETPPPKPKDNKDKERERERERDKPNDPNQPTEKPSQQEITNLKTELNQVKNDLEKLKEFIKKVEDKKKNKWKNNSDLENILKEGKNKLKDLEKKNAPKTSSSDKGFWRKEVVIPLVLVLVVIIFIGIIFWVRKKRIKDS